MNSPAERRKLHCNLCRGTTWHAVLLTREQHHYEEGEHGPSYEEHMVYRLAECNGCESISLHTAWTNSAQPAATEEQWPPKISRHQPKWMFQLWLSENIENPFKLEFLREIYAALKAGSLRLAVIGVRALLEQVMLQHVSDQGTFKKNLDAFESAGFISHIQRLSIEPVIEAGHASIHRGFKATYEQVEAILDVTENILESLYISKERAAGLSVPPRSQPR